MTHDPYSHAFEIAKFNRMVDNTPVNDLPDILKQLFLLYTNTCVMYRALLDQEITARCQIEFGKTIAQNEDNC